VIPSKWSQAQKPSHIRYHLHETSVNPQWQKANWSLGVGTDRKGTKPSFQTDRIF
jgi:hypothetical protein